MKIAAIISEYNPFHNGHRFHIEETRRRTGADAVAVVMSGNFVQRGDIAVFDKITRANAAVAGGADIVLELPTESAMQTAEYFARDAVYILDSLGTADLLAFGAETEDTEKLVRLGKFLAEETESFGTLVKKSYSEGESFPNARQAAVTKCLGSEYAALLESPNNILAVEYIKWLFRFGSEIQPVAIERRGAAHDSEKLEAAEEGIASASYVRALLKNGGFSEAERFIPKECAGIFAVAKLHTVEGMGKAAVADIIKKTAEQIRGVPDVTEGLENRIREAARSAMNFDSLCEAVKTKRYPLSRIRRIILSSYLGIEGKHRSELPRYIRVLAHNEVGRGVIAAAKKTTRLPIVRNNAQINKLGDAEIKAARDRELEYDLIYRLF